MVPLGVAVSAGGGPAARAPRHGGAAPAVGGSADGQARAAGDRAGFAPSDDCIDGPTGRHTEYRNVPRAQLPSGKRILVPREGGWTPSRPLRNSGGVPARKPRRPGGRERWWPSRLRNKGRAESPLHAAGATAVLHEAVGATALAGASSRIATVYIGISNRKSRRWPGSPLRLPPPRSSCPGYA